MLEILDTDPDERPEFRTCPIDLGVGLEKGAIQAFQTRQPLPRYLAILGSF